MFTLGHQARRTLLPSSKQWKRFEEDILSPLSELFVGTICMSTRWANINLTENRRAEERRVLFLAQGKRNLFADRVLDKVFWLSTPREAYRKVRSFLWENTMEHLYGSHEGRWTEAVCRPVRALEIRKLPGGFSEVYSFFFFSTCSRMEVPCSRWKEKRGKTTEEFRRGCSNLESVYPRTSSPGERFFLLPAPTTRKRKGIASTMVMALGLTRKFWNFASVVTLRLVEIFGLGHLGRKSSRGAYSSERNSS